MAKLAAQTGLNRYTALIETIFFTGYSKGVKEIFFERDDLPRTAKRLGIELPKNLGDVVYSIRYRIPMTPKILATQPSGMEWIIEGTGKSRYVFRLSPINRIKPNPVLVAIKVPDATPQIIAAYTLSDEQALLAVVRCNRLIDTFLGLTTYSLQNHLRTTVRNIGQIEIDEIYVGVDKFGRQFVIPVQAKGGTDQLSPVQTKQDISCCKEKFPKLICRAISAQFMSEDLIALFEMTPQDDRIKVVEERHYKLVPAEQITSEDLQAYSDRS